MTKRLVAPEKTKKEKWGRTRRTGEISRQGGMETEVDGAVESHAVAGWGVYANGAGMGFSCGTGLANASSESKFHLS